MTAQSSGVVHRRIAESIEDLSPQLRRAAHYVMANPEEIAMHSLREVAQSAGIAPPTLSRLARALHCSTYEDLRDMCRKEVKARGISFAEKAAALQSEGGDPLDQSPTAFVVKQAQAALTTVQDLLSTVDVEEMRRVIDRVSAADRIAIVGSLSSAAFAQYFGYMAAMALGSRVVIDQPGVPGGGALADLSADDAVIVIAHAPYTERSVRAGRLASRAGAFTVAVTDDLSSPVAILADSVFVLSTDSPQFFPSYVSTLVFLEAFTGMLVRRGGAGVAEHVASVERMNRSLGEYWTPGP